MLNKLYWIEQQYKCLYSEEHVEIWLTFCIIIFLLRKLKYKCANRAGRLYIPEWKWKIPEIPIWLFRARGVVFFQFSDELCKTHVENLITQEALGRTKTTMLKVAFSQNHCTITISWTTTDLKFFDRKIFEIKN